MAASSPEAPLARLCSRQGCKREAVSTLTYVYSDSTAVVGPLSVHNEPHAYDLCGPHAQRLTAPRGWEILRVEIPDTPEPEPAAAHAPAVPLPGTRVAATPEPAHGAASEIPDTAPSGAHPETGPLAEVRPLKVRTTPQRQDRTVAPAPTREAPHSSSRSEDLAADTELSTSPKAAEAQSASMSDDFSADRSDDFSGDTAQGFSGEEFDDEEYSLASEIFASEHPESDPVSADQPKAMRIPHLRRRTKRG